MRGLIWENYVCPCDIDIVDGREDGTWWDCTDKENTAGRRTEPIRYGVLHHQAGEGKAKQTYNVLNKREKPNSPGEFYYLSVHFEIDQYGVITQMADLDTVCHQAGGVNNESWGVEIASIGCGDPSNVYPREKYTDTVNGVTRHDFLKFYRAQIESALRLCFFVNTLLGLPLVIPADASGVRAVRSVLPKDQLEKFKGILGHYMLTEKKIDPSPHLLDELIGKFASMAAGKQTIGGPLRSGTS